MATNVYVNVIARTSGFTRGMRQAQRGLRDLRVSVGRSYASLMRLSAAILGVGGVTYALKKMVEATADTETALAKFNVVFGEQAKAMRTWANEFSRNMKLAQTDTLKYLSSVQDLLVPLGLARKDAAELSKIAVQAAVDLARFGGREPADAIRALQGALTGETEAM